MISQLQTDGQTLLDVKLLSRLKSMNSGIIILQNIDSELDNPQNYQRSSVETQQKGEKVSGLKIVKSKVLELV